MQPEGGDIRYTCNGNVPSAVNGFILRGSVAGSEQTIFLRDEGINSIYVVSTGTTTKLNVHVGE